MQLFYRDGICPPLVAQPEPPSGFAVDVQHILKTLDISVRDWREIEGAGRSS